MLLNPLIVISKFFNNFTKFFLSIFVISFTFLFGSIPLIFIIVGINFCGSNLSKLFLKILFFSSLKSLNILSFSFSSESAGLKSIFNEILFSLISC